MIAALALFNLGFALFHLCFWRLFGWPESLEGAGRVNGGITQVLNLCLTYVFLVVALWLGFGAPAPGALLAIAGFWAFRAALQPFYFDLRHPLSRMVLALFLIGAAAHAGAALHEA